VRIIAVEEHFSAADVVARIPFDAIAAAGWARMPAALDRRYELADLGVARIAAMDKDGIAMQVLSHAGPGATLLAGAQAVDAARDINNHLARAVAEHPRRFAGFAHLPLSEAKAAADELTRSVEDLGLLGALVSGTTNGAFLDDERFDALLARAALLGVPIYLHPEPPPRSVWDAYYSGLPGDTGAILATGGWGWHSETALHVLRLLASGCLERHRDLKLIVGHMGEGLPAMLERLDQALGPATAAMGHRSPAEALREQLWLTTSGYHDTPSFKSALLAFGIDRILFSADYPFLPNAVGRRVLTETGLGPDERHKIAGLNAQKLLGIPPGYGDS
jgi:predicted TIM-barrel fold metal-dependent hydrolase